MNRQPWRGGCTEPPHALASVAGSAFENMDHKGGSDDNDEKYSDAQPAQAQTGTSGLAYQGIDQLEQLHVYAAGLKDISEVWVASNA